MNEDTGRRALFSRKRILVLLALFVVLLSIILLFLPERTPVASGAGRRPFFWNQPEYWSFLQAQFVNARRLDPDILNRRLDQLFVEGERLTGLIGKESLRPDDPLFSNLETNLFQLAPLVAASPPRAPEYCSLVNHVRETVKQQSVAWDLGAEAARTTLYRLIFGGRSALEEVLLQATNKFEGRVLCNSNPGAGPAVDILGVKLHSGDILISRGAAPTSALISRGNDYPGCFSHAALLYVDQKTGQGSVIESHIERGVVVSSIKDYLADPKLRLMALRLRPDLALVKSNALLGHEAALFALRNATRSHIPYDFEMNCEDHTKQFCSEVVSAAYEPQGIRLWMGMTHISSPTLASWLGSLGVRYFRTQEPADLEYDPQLEVIAEWRDPESLRKAHLDDAVIDVMVETAPLGHPLPYSRFRLPLVRVAKAYSVLLNSLGKTGPVPEGMSSTTALRVDALRARHAEIKSRLTARATAYAQNVGYFPPYWELVRLAKEAAAR